MMSRVLLTRAGLLTLVACGSGGGFPDAPEIDAPPAPGAFSLAWSLTDTDGNPVTCEQVGAVSVTLILHNRAEQGGFTEVFTCGVGMGTTPSLRPGSYDVAFELVGPGGGVPSGVIATAPSQQAVELGAGETVELAPVVFDMDVTGGMKLHLSAGAAGGNCAPTDQSGAGITTMTLSLNKGSDQSCVPVTFTIGAGAIQPASTYTVNCASPVPAPCIESDQEVSVSGLVAGSYVIHIRGARGGSECYRNDDTLPVPPIGRDLERTLNLGRDMIDPACQ